MPRSKPPTIAPFMLPYPPNIAAENPFKASITPALYDIVVIGVIMMPATAPMPPLKTKASIVMRWTAMPMRAAPLRFSATALMAFPTMVLLKKKPSKTTTRSMIARIQRVCGKMAAWPQTRGSSPEKGGRIRGVLPQINMATSRMVIDAPTVIITRMRILFDRALRTGPISMSQPTPITTRTARGNATNTGIPTPRVKLIMVIAPSITNSPWAKLTMPVALWMMPKPKAIRA